MRGDRPQLVVSLEARIGKNTDFKIREKTDGNGRATWRNGHVQKMKKSKIIFALVTLGC